MCFTEKKLRLLSEATHLLSEAVFQLVLMTFGHISVILDAHLHTFEYKEPV